MSMFKILKNLKDYEIVCKKRGHHEPESKDVSDFIKNTAFPKETFCQDCGFILELKLDDEDSNAYWIQEI